MFASRGHIALAVMVASSLAASPRLADAAPQYSFTRIADTSGGFSSLFNPVLSEDGSVAFVASLRQGGFEVLAGADKNLRSVAKTSANFSNFHDYLSISGNGSVAFLATGPAALGGSAIFKESGGTVELVADSLTTYSGLSVPSSKSGNVAFLGVRTSGGSEILRASGAGTIAIASTGAEFRSLGTAPTVNEQGTVAFSAIPVGSSGTAIFTGSGGALTTIVDASAHFNVVGEPVINASNTVAFLALEEGAGRGGIYTSSGGVLKQYADLASTGQFFSINGGPSLNNKGNIVFAARTAAGNGLFISGDPIGGAVLTAEDGLFGLKIEGLFNSREAINDRGQIAFLVDLLDPSSGLRSQAIVRADPFALAVPEPTAYAFVTAGVCLLSATLSRRRRPQA